MGTVKIYNGRNNFLNTYFLSIPYYVLLGCSRQRDASKAQSAYERDAGNVVGKSQGGLLTPVSPFGKTNPEEAPVVPEYFSLGPGAIESGEWRVSIGDASALLSPFHYQLLKVRCKIRNIIPFAHHRTGVFRIWRKRSTKASERTYMAG